MSAVRSRQMGMMLPCALRFLNVSSEGNMDVELLNGDGFGKISRFVHVATPFYCDVVR